MTLYNPYNLEIVSANTARSEPVYFTASATSITRVSDAKYNQHYYTK